MNRMAKMLDLLMKEEDDDNSASADMLREMVGRAGSALAEIYGDRDIQSESDRAEFLIVLSQFTVILWAAAVPIMHDETPEHIRKTFNQFTSSLRRHLSISQDRMDVLQYYAKSTRTMN